MVEQPVWVTGLYKCKRCDAYFSGKTLTAKNDEALDTLVGDGSTQIPKMVLHHCGSDTKIQYTGVAELVGAATQQAGYRCKEEQERIKIVKKYQEILESKFPNIIVRLTGMDDDPIIEVYRVPNDRMKEFAIFALHGLPEILESQGVEYLPMMEFSEDQTKKYHPDLIK